MNDEKVEVLVDNNENKEKINSMASETLLENIENQDKIGRTGTNKGKPTEEVVFEGDEDLDSGIKKTKTKVKTNFRYHFNINKKCLKYSTLIIIIIYIIIILVSSVMFHVRREKYPFLFCFEFLDRFPEKSQDKAKTDIIYFLTDLTSFYIIHLVIIFLFICAIYLLFKGTRSEINSFFNDMSIFLIGTLIFNIPIFFIGMNTESFYGNHLQPIAYLILTFFGLICISKIYLVTKRHSYKDVLSVLNRSMLISFLAAFQCYSFIFCLIYFIMNFFKPNTENGSESIPEIEIILGLIYLCIGIIFITIFKDIFFNITMVIIENGLLYAKRTDPYLLANIIVNISIVAINFASIAIVIFAYNKKVFRLKLKDK